jgi:hypothetical protein
MPGRKHVEVGYHCERLTLEFTGRGDTETAIQLVG